MEDSLRGTRRLPGFRAPVGPRAKLGPEFNTWYWNPYRVGAGEAPISFRQKLREIDPENLIDVRWNPVVEKWGVFYKNPKIAHPICSGWVLLFLVEPRELDERVLARLYNSSAAKWGNGRQYFQAVVRELEREKELKDKARREEAIDLAMPFWEHSRISNIGKGNKFSKYHA